MVDKLERRLIKLFGIELSDLNEDLAIDESCKSKLYFQAVNKFNLYFKLLSYKIFKQPLVYEHNQKTSATLDHLGRYINRFTVEDSISDPPVVFQNLKIAQWIWRSRFSRLLCMIILNYITFKYAAVAVLRYKYDSSLKNWQANLRANASRTEKCALKEDILEIPEDIKIAREWLIFLHDPMIDLTGTPILFYSFICITNILVSSVTKQVISNCNVYFDTLTFLVNPHFERHRIQLELDKLATHLLRSISNVFREQYKRSYSHDIILNFTDKLSSADSKRNNGAPKLCNQAAQQRAEVLCYFNYLIGVARKVKPANLTADWHKNIVKLTHLLSYPLISTTLGVLATIVFMLMLCLTTRVRYRLNYLECQNWNPNGTFIEDILNLADLTNPSDVEVYKQFDGSLRYELYLSLKIELWEYLTLRTSLGLIEFSASYIYIALCLVTYQIIYWFFFFDKFIWLHQVQEQIRCCADIALVLNAQDEDRKLLLTNHHILTKLTTITYFNYFLFKMQRYRFIPTASVFINILVSLGYVILLICYTVAMQTRTVSNSFILTGLSYFIVQITLYTVTAAYLFGKFNRIIKDVSRLVTYSRNYSHEQGLIFDLWRRQLIDSNERKKLFGIKLFSSAYISYKLFLSMSLYMMLLWIIYFRMIRHSYN